MVSMDECGYIYVYGRMSNAQRWKVASNVIYLYSLCCGEFVFPSYLILKLWLHSLSSTSGGNFYIVTLKMETIKYS